MKAELSSLDLHYLIQEFQILLSGKIDKVFQKENVFLFQLYVPGVGKKYLRVSLPSLIYITEHKETYDDSGKFGISIRKHIKNNRIRKIEQLQFERIIKITVESKDSIKYLYLELFKPGNVILTREDGKIIMASIYKGFGSRLIRPGKEYEYPKKEYNFLEINAASLTKMFENSDKSSVIITLATILGLGGKYAELLCSNAKIDKKATKLTITELKRLLKEIILLKNTKTLLNKDLDAFFTVKTIEDTKIEHESKFVKEKKKIELIIRQQEIRIKGLEKSVIENQRKGEYIYKHYTEINKIINQLKKAQKSMSMKEIKSKIKNKMIKDIKNNEIVLDL